MRSNLAARVAWRYLRSKKSHSAVGTISIVSVCAMAVATAAIVCVLSVFNGFQKVISGRLDTLTADVTVMPSKGKVFANADSLAAAIRRIPGVAMATPTLADNALVIIDSREMPVLLKGVDPAAFRKVTQIDSLFQKDFGGFIPDSRPTEKPSAALAIGVAAQTGATPESEMLLFAPRREGRVNMANPLTSFTVDSLDVTGIFRSDQQQFDENTVITDIATARRLFQYDSQASAVEVKCATGHDAASVAAAIQSRLGDSYIAKDRLRMQEMNFRMIKIEKWVSFLLLFFILVIASFNIISSLSMLVLEKQPALSTLSALGMPRRQIGAVFAWESIYVSMIGGVAGLLLGVVLCLLQQEFGLITVGTDEAIITAYPVELKARDLAVTAIPVVLIGLATAAITDRFARSRISTRPASV